MFIRVDFMSGFRSHIHNVTRLTGQIKQFWLESGCVYGYRKIHFDLRDTGLQCGVNRVWRLMRRAGIKAKVGYRSPLARKDEASIVAPKRLQGQFNPDALDERWVTDITYIRTHEGWLYLAVVVDLFSRKVIGCSMQPRMTKDIVLNALLMAVWRRNPQKQLLVHSDQGSQHTSHEWQSFLKSHGLGGSMSRRGNFHDNAVAQSFFHLLKRERIKKELRNAGRSSQRCFLITSKCFITLGVGMFQVIRCHRMNMKTSIINGSKVSRLAVAIHDSILFQTIKMEYCLVVFDLFSQRNRNRRKLFIQRCVRSTTQRRALKGGGRSSYAKNAKQYKKSILKQPSLKMTKIRYLEPIF